MLIFPSSFTIEVFATKLINVLVNVNMIGLTVSLINVLLNIF